MHANTGCREAAASGCAEEMQSARNLEALFSDTCAEYVEPMEPEPGASVTIRFRTARAGADEVWLVSDPLRRKMQVEKRDGVFDFYAARLKAGREMLCYVFEVVRGQARIYYGADGIAQTRGEAAPFRVCPGFSTPDWAKGAVMYQIFTDRFCNGDPSNDVLDGEYRYDGRRSRHVSDWYQRPEAEDTAEFYGGDLRGVMSRLDYLQELGIEAVYFNPLFVSPSSHKYDTQDYEHIDPHFGQIPADRGDLCPGEDGAYQVSGRYVARTTDRENLEASDALFAELVREAHARGIRVILDGVFNHCGSFHRWIDRGRVYESAGEGSNGAYLEADSPYRAYFDFADERPEAWPENASYRGWWDVGTLPKLNYEKSEELISRILAAARKWVSPPYCADGWRLDVAADLGHGEAFNHMFWKAFRQEVKAANPDAVIIAEHYGDASAWLEGDEWDSVMNYDAFMEPVTWFFTGMEKHSDAYLPERIGDASSFLSAMRTGMRTFPAPSLLCAMNQLSNHDHSRFLTRTNHTVGRIRDFDYDAASEGTDPAVMRQAVLFQMTWPGAPTLYYGDEAGLAGFTDPDNRRTYPWGREDGDMLTFHRLAIAMHREHEVLRTGSVRMLSCGEGYLSYARFCSSARIVCVFSSREEDMEVKLPVWTAGVPMDGSMTRIFCTDSSTFTLEQETFHAEHGELVLTLAPHSAVVLASDGGHH